MLDGRLPRRFVVSSTTRRNFIKKTALSTGLAAAPAFAQTGANDRINIAEAGIHGRGRSHYREYARMPGVRIAYLCDVDERLFPAALDQIEKTAGYRPKTQYAFRKLLEDKDLDAVSIATPDYWHALHGRFFLYDEGVSLIGERLARRAG